MPKQKVKVIRYIRSDGVTGTKYYSKKTGELLLEMSSHPSGRVKPFVNGV